MIEWIAINGVSLLVAILATEKLAQFVVKFTSTPKDDAIVAKVYKAVEWLAGQFRASDLEPPKS